MKYYLFKKRKNKVRHGMSTDASNVGLNFKPKKKKTLQKKKSALLVLLCERLSK